MTTIADFKAAERALAMQFTAFEEMKQNPELRKALELDAALEAFCAEHKTTRQALYDLLALDIEPDQKPAKKTAASSAKAAAPKGQQFRKAQVYKIRWFRNPHTGEELEVRGNRDGRFNAWNIEYGRDVVQSWKFREEDLPPKVK
ncbi:hypothetical protein D3C84_666190 [compost metagenome]